MVTIGWPAAIIFLIGYYWPVTLSFAITLIATVFYHTKNVTWRVLSLILAVIVMIPAIWLLWVTLSI